MIVGIIVVPFLIFIFPIHVNSTGWLRFCANGLTYRANPNECSGGYWLKRLTSPQCVCVHGVWVLSKGYCDPNFAIVVGNGGTCFALSVEVRWIRMIGYADNPFAPQYFISNKYFDRIDVSTPASSSKPFSVRDFNAGAINPFKAFQSTDDTLCVKSKKVTVGNMSGNGIKDEDIYETYPDTFNFVPLDTEEKEWSFKQVDVCGPNTNQYAYVYGVKEHQFFQHMESVIGSSIPHKCNTTCIEDNEWFPESSTPGNSSVDASEDSDTDRPCLPSSDTPTDTPNRTRRELQEQNKRIALSHINFVLFKHKSPEVNLSEYTLFQKSRRIFEKVCPRTEVPPLFLRGIIRMFRHAVNESLSSHPYLTLGDEAEQKRILDALTKCQSEAPDQPMQFQLNTTECPPEFQTVTYKYKDGKIKPVGSDVKCNLRYNNTKFDYIVETAWKVVVFSHYFCSSYFGNGSYDHSRYLEKMAMFFNREIQNRWANPNNVSSFLSYVFPNYDLENIGIGIDRCVGAVKTLSDYKKWIDRPKIVQYCGQELGDDEYLSSTPSTPITAHLSNGGSKDPKSIRSMTWNNTAYCLKNWKQPLTIIPSLKQEAIHACEKEGSSHMFS